MRGRIGEKTTMNRAAFRKAWEKNWGDRRRQGKEAEPQL